MTSRCDLRVLSIVAALASFVLCQPPRATGQTPQSQFGAGPQIPGNANPGQAARELPSESIRPNYVLGTNDQILVRAPQAAELNDRPFRIDSQGFINFPVAGRVKAAGMTVQDLEADLVRRLREFIREPQVLITVVQYRSEPVFVVGDFRAPGIYPLQGRRTLVEMLSSVGGLQPNASRRIKITRRSEYGPIPLPSAVEDPEKKLSTVEIGLGSLTENVNPAEDIVLRPYDIISVERAELVYVSGEVGKAGGLELGERESISVTQALTMAGGFTAFASRDKVRVLRPILDSTRRAEIDINLKRVFEGKDNDFPLLPNDVLYIPRASARSFLGPLTSSMLVGLPYIIVTLILR